MISPANPKLAELAYLVLEVAESAAWAEQHRPDLRLPTANQVREHFRAALRTHGLNTALALARLAYKRCVWPCSITLPSPAELPAEAELGGGAEVRP